MGKIAPLSILSAKIYKIVNIIVVKMEKVHFVLT